MELKSKFCFNREEVTKFINDNNITKENIQNIVAVEDKHFIIFYWAKKANLLNE
jgi:hypothetical protein